MPRLLVAQLLLGMFLSCSNQVVWTALVHTQDFTPPLLTVLDRSPPEFDSFNVTVQLNEAGTIYAGLLLSSNAAAVTAAASCPPVFQVRDQRHMLAGVVGCV